MSQTTFQEDFRSQQNDPLDDQSYDFDWPMLYERLGEAEDIAGSIRHALRCQQFTSVDPQTWKWVALALHSALQGACVCHLVSTASPFGAVTKQNAGELPARAKLWSQFTCSQAW